MQTYRDRVRLAIAHEQFEPSFKRLKIKDCVSRDNIYSIPNLCKHIKYGKDKCAWAAWTRLKETAWITAAQSLYSWQFIFLIGMILIWQNYQFTNHLSQNCTIQMKIAWIERIAAAASLSSSSCSAVWPKQQAVWPRTRNLQRCATFKNHPHIVQLTTSWLRSIRRGGKQEEISRCR